MFMRVNSQCAHQVRPPSQAEANQKVASPLSHAYPVFDIEAAGP
jgi:hypothetical protein